jgi:hypothetical protein
VIDLVYLFIVTPAAFLEMVGILVGTGAAVRAISRHWRRHHSRNHTEQEPRKRAA